MASTDPRLIQAVQELDSGTRALLDLSLRRAISDEKVAGALGVEIAEIPRRRARGIAELADKLAVPGPAELALLLVALPDLPEEAWGVPNPSLPKVTKVSKTRRVRALRRVAVAASPLVAAAAVMAALIVSSGSGDKHVQISATSALGGKQHQPAASAKAPAKPRSKLGMPATAPDIIASAQGPTPADLPSASSARTLRQRARHRHRARHHSKHHKAAPKTGPPSTDRFASSVPRPDAYVPPPKPVKQRKQHPRHHHHKVSAPTPEPTPQPEPTAPITNNQTTTTLPTPKQIITQPPQIKKPSLPNLHVGDDQTNKKPDGQGNGCGSGGSGHANNSQSGDQHSYGPQSDGSQSDKQSQADYQKAPDPKSLMGIFEKHRGGNYKG